MQKIIPFLWFDNQAEAAMNFYVSTFKNSKIKNLSHLPEGPAKGNVIGSFEIENYELQAIDAGPDFKFSPAISFSVDCETTEEIDRLWAKLSEGGTVMMELTKYPFAEKYGWLKDKFGVSWQLIIRNNRKQKITPSFLFVGDQFGKVDQALNFYTSKFNNSKINEVARYEEGEHDQPGKIKYSLFTLENQEFIAMESSFKHLFAFTPAISFIVNCESQEEIDKFWADLSLGGNTEQCGWLKDQFGISWQIIPKILNELISDKDPEKGKRVIQSLLKMTKIDIETLKKA